jgi:hypothetical protein
MKKGLLKSYAIGFLIIASLWGFAMYGATHQDDERLSDAAYVVAGIIDLPVMALYGIDGRGAPIPVSIALYLIEAGVLALPIYLIFFSWKKQN